MSHIVTIATKTPPHKITQKSFATHVAKASKLDATQTAWLEKLYINSCIETRYSVLEDFFHPDRNWDCMSTEARNELYKLYAPALCQDVAEKALEAWGKERKTITHIVFVSCTGIMVPGIQSHLIARLGLSPQTSQFSLTMMGCFGAFKALEFANALCSQSRDAKVLIVLCELCSLHFQPDASYEKQIGNALFADGAAACIVAHETPALFRIEKHASQQLENSLHHMSWDLSDQGLVFGLKKEVPEQIQQHISAFTKRLCDTDADLAIHPGGKGILQAVEEALNQKSSVSWDILKRYGNTSSTAFLFVLEELAKQKSDNAKVVGLGFGPGLMFEGICLERL